MYSIQFVPLTGSSVSMSLRFINGNRRSTRTLVRNQTVSASIADYGCDYDKFLLPLNAGQTLRLNTPSQTGQLVCLGLCDPRGIGVAGTCGGGVGNEFIYTATKTDTYHLLFYHTDLATHNYSTTVSITP